MNNKDREILARLQKVLREAGDNGLFGASALAYFVPHETITSFCSAVNQLIKEEENE